MYILEFARILWGKEIQGNQDGNEFL